MELSLQPKYSYKKLYNKREEMIIKEKLHIQDSITYMQFESLYKKYGSGLSEKDFAKYFLDIDYASYYKLQSKYRKTAIILEREFYLDEEFEEIRKQVLNLGLTKKDRLNYKKLVELYNIYGRKFSLKTFAEEELTINAHRVDDLNSNKESEARILTREFEDKKTIRKIRESLASKEKKLHMNSQIKLSEFNELYQIYVINEGLELDRKAFALKVLGISNDVYGRFEGGKREKVFIFSTYPINPEYIANLREKVIISENLYIDEPISAERFDELYENYAGVLTEEVFAEEILDSSIDTVKMLEEDIKILIY